MFDGDKPADKLFIPPLGSVLTLSKPWTFDLYNEHRNETLMKYVKDRRKVAYGDLSKKPVTLPAATKLKIDRYYIRQGLKDFDSVSFFLLDASVTLEHTSYPVEFKLKPIGPSQRNMSLSWQDTHERIEHPPVTTKRKSRIRFWVKLADANEIEFSNIETPKKKDV